MTSLVFTSTNSFTTAPLALDASNRRRQKSGDGAGDAAYAKHTGGTRGERGKLAAGFADAGEQRARVPHERIAVRRRRHPPGVAREQRHADGVLEVAKELGGRRLGYRDVARGLAQAAPFRKGDDQRELAKLEARRERDSSHFAIRLDRTRWTKRGHSKSVSQHRKMRLAVIVRPDVGCVASNG